MFKRLMARFLNFLECGLGIATFVFILITIAATYKKQSIAEPFTWFVALFVAYLVIRKVRGKSVFPQ